MKQQDNGLLGALVVPLAAQLVQTVISSVVKGISGRWVRRAGSEHTDEISSCAPSFKQYWDY